MSQATISSRPSPSMSRKRVSATIGTGAARGGLSSDRTNGAGSAAGQGSGAGSVSGARASKYEANGARSFCASPLCLPSGTPIRLRLKRAMSCRRCRHCGRGRSLARGATWHTVHSERTVSTKPASGSGSGRSSRPRIGGGAGGAGGAESTA